MSLTEAEVSNVAAAWDRHAVTYQNARRLPTDVVSYGPGVGTEADLRLLGPVSGKRVLDLGCGGGQATIALARQGAIAIGVDISVEQLAFARRLIEQEDVKVELKQGDLAELAFQRADSVDLVFSAFAFQYVPDLNRVFRQVHRVLKPQSALVFSIPHPASYLAGKPADALRSQGQLSLDTPEVRIDRSYYDRSPVSVYMDDTRFVEYRRTVSDIYMGLIRSGYRVDVILEPETASADLLPSTLVVRARKEA